MLALTTREQAVAACRAANARGFHDIAEIITDRWMESGFVAVGEADLADLGLTRNDATEV